MLNDSFEDALDVQFLVLEIFDSPAILARSIVDGIL